MSSFALGSILLDVIAPIALIATLGAILGRALRVDARVLSRVTLYVLSPALVFRSAYHSDLGAEFWGIVGFVVAMAIATGLIALLVIKLKRYPQPTASAFALSTMFGNAGNYGLPFILFAFGNEGLERAVILFAIASITGQTLAVFIAARASMSGGKAVSSVFKLPSIYAVTAGLLLARIGFTAPETLMRSVDLLSNAAVPIMLLIMGIELSRARLNANYVDLGLAALLRLVVAPVLAFGITGMLALSGVARNVCVIESAMPTAVGAAILAVEFESHPEFVTSAILVSTLGSVISLTILLSLLTM